MNTALRFEADRTLALTAPPLECKECHVMRACFVNRDGRTRCFDCDRAYVARGLAAVNAARDRSLQTNAPSEPEDRCPPKL